MKSYLIDTNIIIALINKEISIELKIQKIKNDISIACISIGELVLGAKQSQNKDKNLNAICDLIKDYTILNINTNTAFQYGDLKSQLRAIGKPIPDNDNWIAAIAKEHDLTIITRDKHLLEIDFIKTERW